MSDQFIGELRIMSFNFAPKGWALANGQLIPINQNQALFSLFGTMYGGDGITNFALPNLQGRIALHFGGGLTQGQAAGSATVTLQAVETPTHGHSPQGNNSSGGLPALVGNTFGKSLGNAYGPPNSLATMASTTSSTGGSQAHENRMPSTVLSFCVSLTGIFPSRN